VNPPSAEAVNAKARDLVAPVLGAEKTDRLIAQINTLERVDDVRALRPLFTMWEAGRCREGQPFAKSLDNMDALVKSESRRTAHGNQRGQSDKAGQPA